MVAESLHLKKNSLGYKNARTEDASQRTKSVSITQRKHPIMAFIHLCSWTHQLDQVTDKY